MNNLTRAQIAHDVVTNGGQAEIKATHPSAQVRALTPAIEKAYAAFENQNAAALPLRADRQRIARELKELRDSKHPARAYDQTLDDELAREVAKLDVALTANANKAKKLAVDYLVAVVNNPRADEARQHSAKLALKAHEETVAALAALEDALARREVYYSSAGRPAEWKHHRQTLRRQHSEGRFLQAHEILGREVADFPAGDVQTLADGGEVLTLAQLQSAQRQAEVDRAAAMKAATRERNRRESIIERNGN